MKRFVLFVMSAALCAGSVFAQNAASIVPAVYENRNVAHFTGFINNFLPVNSYS